MSKESSSSRIRSLLNSKSLRMPCKSKEEILFSFENFEKVEVSESSLVGKICGGVVVKKNEVDKELLIHLIMTYDHSKILNISSNRFVAFIKDYELKADLSIFTYLNSFKDVEVGTLINAWVRRIDKRDNENLFELHLNRQPDIKFPALKLGVANDNVKIPESVLKVYEKEHKLPMNFQILYYPNYDNPGLENTIEKRLNINSSSSMHSVSNLDALTSLGFNYHRVRFVQERLWRDEHLELGLECIKSGNHKAALECLRVALKFDRECPDIYIARACAYFHMNNISDAIKEIKEALKIDPNNERAKKYYEQFQKEIAYKCEEPTNLNKKRTTGNGHYEIVHKK